MKRKDLYNYIREEIINELKEGAATDAAKDAGVANPSAAAKSAIDTAKKSPSKTATIVGPKGAKIIDQNTPLEETDLEEMARKAGAFTVGDPDKFKEAQDLYSVGIYADVLKAIAEAGENGITQQELGEKLGKAGTSLNPILNVLKFPGAISGGRLAAAPKPEKPEKEEPSGEPETDDSEMMPADDYYKSEEPEEKEAEPEAAPDKEVEKTVGTSYADMSPEEEDTYNRFRQAIINKAKVMRDDKASKEDKAKAKAAIDNYKAKADLKKLFLKKGLSLIDFISDELNK